MSYARPAQFAAMCAIWGLTWIAIKTGVESIPPVFFAATRFVAAGVLLLVIFHRQLSAAVKDMRFFRLLIVSLLLTTFCYAPLFWGIQRTPSGLAAIINLSLLPIGLLMIGAAFGVERAGRKELAGVALGLIGLFCLYWPELSAGNTTRAMGVLAIAFGTLSACLGSVLSRLWLSDMPTGAASGAITLIGGIGLAIISVIGESVSGATIVAMTAPGPLLSWLFLVIFGSAVAFTLYLLLLNVWGPLRAGLYSFVSPVVALVAGYAILGERLDRLQFAAAGILLVAAAIVMLPQRASQKENSSTVPTGTGQQTGE